MHEVGGWQEKKKERTSAKKEIDVKWFILKVFNFASIWWPNIYTCFFLSRSAKICTKLFL